MSFTLRLVTPEGVTLSEEVEQVTLPGIDGEMGIYANHEPLITQIAPGELSYTKNGGKKFYLAIGEGFVKITAKDVSILVDMALREEEIEEKKVEEAIARAQAAIKQKLLGEEELAATQAMLLKSMAQLKVKRRRHGTGAPPITPS
ncbi:ATP synthase F0F1 subunit epsilon [Methylacidiphilum kamchatkense Kam1]|uniref:ATP synthase epsilon chain n=1 Tax=Methylacidiphilum kamchatkense Kam1 TaxID=1202785 RepID=A0A0C1RU51_9BACT|nr:ATP synthase F1 subunit epsilon [Methylacidiphilum kamchatkense]KIE58516.1 ATP synthase F0F1 subunit epsilon [Methylacidiphilum kamchatkense Kam1]QDQ43333.1 F-type H+-transporting ATPase subunit epsilon [Methylacidiphilum kamchatkense Kam1]